MQRLATIVEELKSAARELETVVGTDTHHVAEQAAQNARITCAFAKDSKGSVKQVKRRTKSL